MAVYKRRWQTKSGVHHCWVCDYFARDPETGSLERVRETFKKKGDAEARWLEVHPKGHKGRANAKARKFTVKQAAELWLDAVKVGRDERDPAESHTLRQYRSHLNLHILPYFGSEKLCDLTRGRVAEFRDDLLRNLSRPMAKKVLASLKGILSECEGRDLVPANPASAIRIGAVSKRNKKPVTIPEKAQIASILAILDKYASQENEDEAKKWRKYRALISAAIYTGMRASELRGLPWTNVDLKAATITVEQKADENGIIGPPKSADGHREIAIPTPLVTLLRGWKLECPPGKDDLVFPNGVGNVESMGNISNRAWYPIRRELKLRFRFHDFRHFHAAQLIEDGANAKEVQAEMGHSSIQITYDIYGHLFRDDEASQMRKARAERLAASLGAA